MRVLAPFVTLLAIALPASAQSTVVVPNAFAASQAPDNNNYPFNFFAAAGGVGRYQQVYTAADFAAAGVSFPMLISEISYRPAIGGSGSFSLAGRTLTIDLKLGDAAVGPDAMSTTFAANLLGNATTVYAGQLTFPTVASVPGTGPYPFSWTIPLQTPYLYTGASDLLFDVEITATTGGGGGSAPLDAINATADPVARRFNQGDPLATVANGGESLGLVTQFTYGPGGPSFVPFGTGCAGAGGFVPAIGSVGLPGLGNASFAATLSNVTGGSVAILAIGLSDDFWLGLPLPFDLTPVGAPGCFLYVSDEVLVLTTAGGVGPGAGTASIGLAIPPTPSLAGGSAHLQWLVFDPILAALRASNAATATVY